MVGKTGQNTFELSIFYQSKYLQFISVGLPYCPKFFTFCESKNAKEYT